MFDVSGVIPSRQSLWDLWPWASAGGQGDNHGMTGRRELGIHLYWIPLGAGGSGFVRMNGRIYEAVKAAIQRRAACDLYHTALSASVPEGRFVVETMWPMPDSHIEARGVTVVGPVFSPWLSFTRVFRYEIRCWQDGLLPDADEAVGGPRTLSNDPGVARRLLDLTPSVPAHTWGRDATGVGDMWNSNSVVSWLITRAGIATESIEAPPGGRAPGWDAGIAAARHDMSARRTTDSGR
jgi:hypothetical protein